MLTSIVLLPLIGFLVNGLWYVTQVGPGAKKAGARMPGLIATTAIAGAFALGVLAFLRLQATPEASRLLQERLFDWISVGDLQVPFTLRLDPLSSLFVLVITGVGSLIHIYSIGYLSRDETPGKFFAYLNLFCAMMLVLVLGGSLPVLFLGWEGVGLCSYLLISYWYSDIEKAKAGKKAFLVNRIGDLGFLLGSFLLYRTMGSLDLETIKTGAAIADTGLLNAAGLLLFLGCTGKSAQIPLYLWLPDAMAGPTPVSALIHAATMVTSGIYLLARLSPLYLLAPQALTVIALIGAATAFFAGTIALGQNDIKKVLAYSTVSQLGYMFLACGVGAFSAGVFHVITHAFFKALLFLGAGSVIHALHEEQDIRRMGGLRKDMPRTFFAFTAGWLALSGIPPFAGFFSKDEILWRAFSSPFGSGALWAVGVATALLTALYMTRLYALVFLGRSRGKGHAHESPSTMTVPLLILGGLSVGGGLLGLPHLSWIEPWLHGVVAEAPAAEGAPALEWVLMAASAGLAAASVGLGLQWFRGGDVDRAKRLLGGVHRLLEHKWYVDELADAVLVRPIHRLSIAAWRLFDVGVIDRCVVGLARLARFAADTGRGIQTGSVQVYSFILLLGLMTGVGVLLYGLL